MRIVIVLLAFILSACAAPTKYATRPDIGDALKQTKGGNINVGAFKAPANFSNFCRIDGPIYPPDYNLSFEGYIQNALVEELKAAGKYNDTTAKVSLSGVVEKLSFSTTANGLTGGTWDIGLRVISSNGKSSLVSEHYQFETSLMAALACQQASEAYLPAVQNLISKLVRSDDFKTLIAP